jgi:hypothetical protein
MPGGRRGSWIRPASARDSAEINLEERRYENGQEPQILDIVAIPMIGAAPRGHQMENHIIDADSYWVKEGRFPWNRVPELLDAPVSLWVNGYSTHAGNNDRVPQASAAQLRESLYLIRPDQVTISVVTPGAEFGNPKKAVRAEFRYRGVRHNIKVTDLDAERTFLANEVGSYPLPRESYFCISLTEAHTDGFCYKLVATIVTEQPI